MNEVYKLKYAAEEAAAESWISAVKLGQTAMASELINSPELAKAKLDGRLLEMALQSKVYAVVINLVTFVPAMERLAMERAIDKADNVLRRLLLARVGYSTAVMTNYLEDGMVHDISDNGVVHYA